MKSKITKQKRDDGTKAKIAEAFSVTPRYVGTCLSKGYKPKSEAAKEKAKKIVAAYKAAKAAQAAFLKTLKNV